LLQQGSILGPLILLVYINDLPRTLNNVSIPLPFADDTSVVIVNKNNMNFQNKTNPLPQCTPQGALVTYGLK
jgi:hypothetical protein